jgi:hypothetical protein
LTEANKHTGIRTGLGSAVCEIDVTVAVYIDLVDVVAYVFNKLGIVDRDLATRHILNKLETIRDDFEWIFEMKPDWYDGIKYYISKASIELGYCLATLEGWYDDEPSEEAINKKD